MNLHIDGSGVTVVCKDTGRRVAVFEHNKHVDGRAEARRYVGSELVAELAQALVVTAAQDNPHAFHGAARALRFALERSGLPMSPEALAAVETLQTRANDDAGATDTSTPPPTQHRRKAGKRPNS